MSCRPFSDDEIRRLVREGFAGRYEKRDLAWFAIGLNTGFRISEILSLRVGDVWKDRMVVHYLNIRADNMKGKKKARTRKIHGRTRASIRVWLKEFTLRMAPDTGNLPRDLFLFQSQEGANRAITAHQARTILGEAMKRIGIVEMPYVMGTHMMRKTYAKRVYEYYLREFQAGRVNREPILMTQIALGHQSIDNTLKYLSFMPDEIPAEVLDLY